MTMRVMPSSGPAARPGLVPTPRPAPIAIAPSVPQNRLVLPNGQPAQTRSQLPLVMQKRIGSVGLRAWSGFIYEQELSSLRSLERRLKVFREMRMDATIGIIEQAIYRPLLHADISVTPAGQLPGDQAAADELKRILFDIGPSSDNLLQWEDHVEDALEHVFFGFSLQQIVAGYKPDGRVGLIDLQPQAQETVFRWLLERQSVELGGVEFRDIYGNQYTIPRVKLLHFTDRGRKRNPEGEGLLLHLWKAWRYKTDLQELLAIGIERDVGGMPVVSLPDGASSTERAEVEDQVEALRQDEASALLVPFGTEVTPYGSGGSPRHNIQEVIDDYTWEMLAYVGAQWLKLGNSESGSRALMQGATDMFALYLRSIQQRMLAVWQQQLVERLAMIAPIRGPSGLPKLEWADPGAPDVQPLLEAYTTAVNAGVITPTRQDEDHFRSAMALPDLPPGMGIGERIPMMPGGPMGGGLPSPIQDLLRETPSNVGGKGPGGPAGARPPVPPSLPQGAGAKPLFGG